MHSKQEHTAAADPLVLPAAEFFAVVREKLLSGRTVCFRVTGSSMLPLFRSGRDSVCIRPCPPDARSSSPKRGDIILFCVSGRYILHRIMRIENGAVVTAGDGNSGFDTFAAPHRPLRLVPLSGGENKAPDSESTEPTGELLGIAEARIRNGRRLDFRSPAYRLSAALWRLLFPLRPFLLRCLRTGSRLRRRFAGK